MKTKFLLIATLFFWTSSFGQKGLNMSNTEIRAKDRKSKNLISDEAFDKMIVQDITYAIFGENNPVSGIKVDISKPEGTISGVFTIKNRPSLLFGFDFKGGVSDRNFSLFKGIDDFNSAFEFKPSLHFIPNWNSAFYKSIPEEIITKGRIRQLDTLISIQLDTLLMATLIYNHHFANFSSLQDTSYTLPNDSNVRDDQKQILIYLTRKFLKKDDEHLDMKNSLDTILQVLDKVTNYNGEINIDKYNNDIVSTYQKHKKKYAKKDEEKIKNEISYASESWTKKNFFWFTISPFARAEKLNLYRTKYNDTDSLYFKPDYPFYYGLNASFNILSLYPNKIAHYFKIGLNLSHSNNITTLNSFNYETRTEFFSYGNSVTEKSKAGVAYNISELKSDFLGQIGAEYYLLPLKSFCPGLYVAANLNMSNLYRLDNVVGRNNDRTQISSEGGMVLNINSREKDKEKSILSLSLYVRFEDITDTRRTSTETNELEPKEDFYERNFSFGLKVGVPITLPEKNKS
jgi:hypothetical protein